MATLIIITILALVILRYLPTQKRGRRHGRTTAYNRQFAAIRPAILRRDGHRCIKCHRRGPGLHVHHIRYRSRGGTNRPENLATVCKSCHEHIHGHKIF